MFSSTLDWLAINAYHECRGEPREGIKAVCKVVLNRARARKQRVKKVILAPSQFSWTDDLLSDDPEDIVAYEKCLALSREAVDEFLNGDIFHGANHYHADYLVPFPYWAGEMLKINKIGKHIFYKG